jgi:hypothetical protein
MMRLAVGVSLWTMAVVRSVNPACTSSTIHFTQLIDGSLRMMRCRRASRAVSATASADVEPPPGRRVVDNCFHRE